MTSLPSSSASSVAGIWHSWLLLPPLNLGFPDFHTLLLPVLLCPQHFYFGCHTQHPFLTPRFICSLGELTFPSDCSWQLCTQFPHLCACTGALWTPDSLALHNLLTPTPSPAFPLLCFRSVADLTYPSLPNLQTCFFQLFLLSLELRPPFHLLSLTVLESSVVLTVTSHPWTHCIGTRDSSFKVYLESSYRPTFPPASLGQAAQLCVL